LLQVSVRLVVLVFIIFYSDAVAYEPRNEYYFENSSYCNQVIIAGVDTEIQYWEVKHSERIAYVLQYLVVLQITYFIIIFHEIKTNSMY